MKVYLSHSIRSPKGNDATHTDMKRNCNRAIAMGDSIRFAIPSVDLYIPGEHEFPPVGYLLQKGYITAEQILEIDCMIIDECDAVLFFCPPDDCELRGGCLVEYNYAKKANKPTYKFAAAIDACEWLAELIIRS